MDKNEYIAQVVENRMLSRENVTQMILVDILYELKRINLGGHVIEEDTTPLTFSKAKK